MAPGRSASLSDNPIEVANSAFCRLTGRADAAMRAHRRAHDWAASWRWRRRGSRATCWLTDPDYAAAVPTPDNPCCGWSGHPQLGARRDGVDPPSGRGGTPQGAGSAPPCSTEGQRAGRWLVAGNQFLGSQVELVEDGAADARFADAESRRRRRCSAAADLDRDRRFGGCRDEQSFDAAAAGAGPETSSILAGLSTVSQPVASASAA